MRHYILPIITLLTLHSTAYANSSIAVISPAPFAIMGFSVLFFYLYTLKSSVTRKSIVIAMSAFIPIALIAASIFTVNQTIGFCFASIGTYLIALTFQKEYKVYRPRLLASGLCIALSIYFDNIFYVYSILFFLTAIIRYILHHRERCICLVLSPIVGFLFGMTVYLGTHLEDLSIFYTTLVSFLEGDFSPFAEAILCNPLSYLLTFVPLLFTGIVGYRTYQEHTNEIADETKKD